MFSSKSALVAILFAAIAAPLPASAASPMTVSPMTKAFLANVTANTAFLDRASRLASERAASQAMRNFAASEAQEATETIVGLADIGPASDRVVVAATPTADDVITGRSVAQDVPAAPAFAETTVTTDRAANGRAPMRQGDLDRLAQASGRAFDNLYWQDQLDALSQIESDYRTYITHGDDPALVALAHRELPALMSRLTALTRI